MVYALVIMAWVVARQTSAVVTAAQLDSLRDERGVLEAERQELNAEIGRLSSREVLEPIAASLGLRESVDSEIVIVTVPDSGAGKR
jgi:cell division protein FtsB